MAAIEIISPANKDRPDNRNKFSTKCAAFPLDEVTVVLVDVVTNHRANLYADLLTQIGQRGPALGEQPPATYAVACRWQPRGKKGRLETWYHPMATSRPLPVLPVWLSDGFGVSRDLEATYERTWFRPTFHPLYRRF